MARPEHLYTYIASCHVSMHSHTTCIGTPDRTAVVRPRCVNVATARAERRHDIDVTMQQSSKQMCFNLHVWP